MWRGTLGGAMKHQWMAGTSPKATRKAKDSVLHHTATRQENSAPTPLQATVKTTPDDRIVVLAARPALAV
jgi:hypothetical protein